MARSHCPLCKAVLELDVLNEINGEEGRLAVRVYRMPVLQCSNGHRLFLHPDFPLLLLDWLVKSETKLPVSTAKGMLVKKHHCAACGEPLSEPDDQRHSFRLAVDLPETMPFEIDLTMPVHRCPKCRKEQVHSLKDVRNAAPAALAHAFKSAQMAAGM
jgi:hypothetical protein